MEDGEQVPSSAVLRAAATAAYHATTISIIAADNATVARPMSLALFVDDHHVRAADGVRRVFHRLEKHPGNPIHVFTSP